MRFARTLHQHTVHQLIMPENTPKLLSGLFGFLR